MALSHVGRQGGFLACSCHISSRQTNDTAGLPPLFGLAIGKGLLGLNGWVSKHGTFTGIHVTH
jgi:hypothetical protein